MSDSMHVARERLSRMQQEPRIGFAAEVTEILATLLDAAEAAGTHLFKIEQAAKVSYPTAQMETSEELAAEAERGYDVSKMRPRSRSIRSTLADVTPLLYVAITVSKTGVVTDCEILDKQPVWNATDVAAGTVQYIRAGHVNGGDTSQEMVLRGMPEYLTVGDLYTDGEHLWRVDTHGLTHLTGGDDWDWEGFISNGGLGSLVGIRQADLERIVAERGRHE